MTISSKHEVVIEMCVKKFKLSILGFTILYISNGEYVYYPKITHSQSSISNYIKNSMNWKNVSLL